MLLDLLAYLKTKDFDFMSYKAEQDAKFPYFTYVPVSEVNKIGVEGDTHTKSYLLQFDIWTKSFKQSVELKDKLEKALFEFKRGKILEFSVSYDYDEVGRDYQVHRQMIEINYIK